MVEMFEHLCSSLAFSECKVERAHRAVTIRQGLEFGKRNRERFETEEPRVWEDRPDILRKLPGIGSDVEDRLYSHRSQAGCVVERTS